MEVVDKLTNEIFKAENDKVFELFTSVVSGEKDQIVRYCLDNIMPLWFCRENIISIKNLRCSTCKDKLIYECQVSLIVKIR